MIDLQELRLKTNGAINGIDSLRGYRPTPYQIIELINRLEAAEAVCTAVKECLPTIHVMEEWQKVKEGQ